MSKVQDTFTHVDGVGTRSIRHMIETISQGDDLTPWESEFADSMFDQLTAWQNSTNWVSANQLSVIERVYKKLYDAGEI